MIAAPTVQCTSPGRPGRAVVAAAAPARLRARLAGPERVARIVHRGRHAVYLELDGWCVGVVAAGATAVPCALRTALPHLGVLADATTARVGDGQLRLSDTTVLVGRLVDVSVPSLRRVGRCSLAELHTPLLAAGSTALAELDDALEAPLGELLGRGSGLTPLGDDVVCGWLATNHALGRPAAPLPDPRSRTTLLSATLIDCAAAGEVIPQFAALVRALAGGDETAVGAAAARLAAVGHTSGAGLVLGAARRLLEETHQDGEA